MSTVPSQMTAIAVREPGGPDVLVAQTRPMPAPGPGEVLVKVAARILPQGSRGVLQFGPRQAPE